MQNARRNKLKSSNRHVTIVDATLHWVFLIIAVLVGYIAGPDNIPFLCFVVLVVVVGITGTIPKVMASILAQLSSR